MKTSSPDRLPIALLASAALALVPAPAGAADNRPSAAPATSTATVAQLNEEGAALYAQRDYRRAIEKFIQAYAVDSDPNLLFNIARCYEELGEIDAAIEKYETFLKTPGADTRGRQRARESLAALREAKNHPPAASAALVEVPEAPAPAEPVSVPVASRTSGDAPSGSALPWVMLGGSVAFAGVGTALYLMGARDHDEVTNARGFGDPSAVSEMTRREADDLVESGDTKKLAGSISFGLAGALAATYVVLLASADDEPAEPGPSLGFSLEPARDGTSVLVQGSF
jgi:tetratricopeptide (TPR) repeat protein